MMSLTMKHALKKIKPNFKHNMNTKRISSHLFQNLIRLYAVWFPKSAEHLSKAKAGA